MAIETEQRLTPGEIEQLLALGKAGITWVGYLISKDITKSLVGMGLAAMMTGDGDYSLTVQGQASYDALVRSFNAPLR